MHICISLLRAGNVYIYRMSPCNLNQLQQIALVIKPPPSGSPNSMNCHFTIMSYEKVTTLLISKLHIGELCDNIKIYCDMLA